MGFRPPNYTQAPNELFDDIAKTLKEGELRVLLVIMRQTFGWQKRWDRISFSQLEQKTGMCRDAVNNSIKSLIKTGLVQRHKEGSIGQEIVWYTLVVEPIEKEPEIPNEFEESIEDSNILYQSSKTTPTSRFRRPTKETLTKERKKREEKRGIGGVSQTRIARSPVASKISLNPETKKFEGITPEDLKTWQETFPAVNVRKEIDEALLWALSTPRMNYRKSLNTWMSNVNKTHTTPKKTHGPKEASDELVVKNKILAHKIVENCPNPVHLNVIQPQSSGMLFIYGSVYDFIKFIDVEFRIKVLAHLKHMKENIEDL